MTNVRWIEDTPYGSKTPFWTRANAGEVLPAPPSPSAWDLVFDNGGSVAGWRDCAVNRLGVDDSELSANKNQCEFIGLIGGYAYLGATWIRVWAERTPGMSAAAIDQAYFGDHPDVPVYVAEPWHENLATTEVMTGWLGWVMGTMEQHELEADRLAAIAIRKQRPDLSKLSDVELLDYSVTMRPVCRRMFDQHINQSGAASIGPGALGSICAAVGRPGDVLSLIAGQGGVDSAAPSYAMWDLGRSAAASPEVAALFAAGPHGLNKTLRASQNPAVVDFVAKLETFLEEFGSRGPNEWDIHAETWETEPDLALGLIDHMRQMPAEQDPSLRHDEREAERNRLTAEIRAMLVGNDEALGTFDAAAKSASTFVPGRERSKTNIIRVIEEVRVAMRELGRRAVERGQIDHPVHLCMLFQDELRSYAAGELTDIRGTVAERSAHYEWLLTLEPPFIVNGVAPANTTWPRKADHLSTVLKVGESIQGMPGCPGVVRGRACVVLDPSDSTDLEFDDILIAPMTDPAWTPLFVPASAVVVNVGAALSHAIIVSRELGIPCAVSVTDATHRIPHGATIEVDGATGVVTLIALP
jgi:rifampicin phosphotransferase